MANRGKQRSGDDRSKISRKSKKKRDAKVPSLASMKTNDDCDKHFEA